MPTLYCYGCVPVHLTALRSIAQRMHHAFVDLPSLDAIPTEMDAPTRFAVPFSAIFDLIKCLVERKATGEVSILALLPHGFRRDVQSESVNGYTVAYLSEDLLEDTERAFARLTR
ncbi:MAG: hypothetical protein Q7S96_04370 [bacterium]|nr:hypothetical protein [bacterium]